jgi:hypothetical protein
MSKAISDVKRDSRTDSANGGWLRRLVRQLGHLSGLLSCLTISTEISTAGIVPLFSSQCVVFLSSGQPTPGPYSVATPFRWSVIVPCSM